MNKYLPLIIGLEGTSLTDNEKFFLSNDKPWGVILFRRNCKTYNEILNLIDDIKSKTHENIPILIDQEGGRVSRLNDIDFPRTLQAKLFGDIYEHDKKIALEAIKLNTSLIAGSLKKIGININTIPVLDLPSAEESGVIGDRAFSSNKEIVSGIGKIVLEENTINGIGSVIKHIPGHGRATVDSHLELPVISDDSTMLENTDFIPFSELKDAPLAMTAHVVYSSYDENNVATLSKKIISQIIRKKINYEGILMTDDISMKALKGDVAENAILSLKAGCNIVLHCNGNFDEISKITDKISKYHSISIDSKLLEIFKQKLDHDLDDAAMRLSDLLNRYI